MSAIPYADQIASVERELGYRRRVYADRVAAGKMTQALADRELARMEAEKVTLEHVDAINRDLLAADEDGEGFGLAVSISKGGEPVPNLESSIERSLEALHQPAPAGEQRELL